MDADVLIIGAGMAGLSAARELRAAGHRVTLLDKGRVAGGRMATRDFDGGRFDYGAQFFTLRDAPLAAMAERWVEEGVAAPWQGHRLATPHGLRRVAEHLADGLDVRCGVTVEALAHQDGCWTARAADGSTWTARAALLTPPVPQSLALLGAAAPEALRDVRYHKTITLLVRVEGEVRLPAGGWLTPDSAVLSTAADNFVKGVSPIPGCLTLHATHAFSEANWDSPASVIVAEILAAAEPWIAGRVRAFYLHRWRYAEPAGTWPELFHADAGRAVAFAGDAFGGPRIGGAASSGLAAAAWLRDRLR